MHLDFIFILFILFINSQQMSIGMQFHLYVVVVCLSSVENNFYQFGLLDFNYIQVLLLFLFAKRSVVSAANYAQRSSFAKDQILFFFL